MKTNFKFIVALLIGFCIIACQNEKDELLDNLNESDESAFLRSSADLLSEFEGRWVHLTLARSNSYWRYLSANLKNNTVDVYKYNNSNQIWKFNKSYVGLFGGYILTTKGGNGNSIMGKTNSSTNPGKPVLRPENAAFSSSFMFEPIYGTDYYKIYYHFGPDVFPPKKAYLTAKVTGTGAELYFTTSDLGELQAWSISIAL